MLFLLFSFCCGAFAQEFGLHFMQRAPLRMHTNPAFMSERAIQVALPSPYLQATHTAFSYSQLVRPDAYSDSLVLDIDHALSRMKDENQLRLQARMDLLAFSLRIRGLQLSMGTALRLDGRFTYPKSLVQLAWEGNAASVGQAVNVAPNVQLTAFQSYQAGLAWQISKKWQLGLRLNYLVGLGNVSTGQQVASLHTEAEAYQLNLVTDYQLRTSMITLPDSVSDFGFELQPYSPNRGLAVDLGAVWQVNERLQLAASVLDLGGIRWKSDARQYHSQGVFTFSGVDVSGYLKGDSVSFEAIADSLEQQLQFVESPTEYRTALPTQLYLSGHFRLLPGLRLGGLWHSEFYRGKHTPTLVVSASKDLGRIFTGGITYTLREGRFDQLGANMLLKAGPLLLYTYTDHLMALLQPKTARSFTFRLGVGVAI
ncbi:MAG: hypothetical protein D6730_11875 [Bacteroidetes bacterium]|nr:MAG: hypothetical protein D6730_11875 [Bacteroidota bacterium]